MSRSVLWLAAGGFLLAAWTAIWFFRPGLLKRRTVTGVLASYGEKLRIRLEPSARAAGLPWPPSRLRLLAFKEERILEAWGAGPSGPFRKLASYPILGASGTAGPKRREGDLQVPEGDYRLTTLNPDSRFHLSLRVDYPNEDDLTRSAVPRDRMGGDIYVHGGRASIGCLAMGDDAIEELFCLAALVEDRRILIAPRDLRRVDAPEAAPDVAALYGSLRRALAPFR